MHNVGKYWHHQRVLQIALVHMICFIASILSICSNVCIGVSQVCYSTSRDPQFTTCSETLKEPMAMLRPSQGHRSVAAAVNPAETQLDSTSLEEITQKLIKDSLAPSL